MDRTSSKLNTLVKTFSEFYQSSHEVYWISSPDFKCAKYISPIFEKIWGRKRDSILKDNKIWDTYVAPADLKFHHPFLEMVKKIKQDGPAAHYNETYRIIRPDGSIRWILDRGHPLFDKYGEYIGVTGVATDITVMKLCSNLPSHKKPIFIHSNHKHHYYLRGLHQKIYLTTREAECAFFLLQGKTAKQIADILDLSFRSVEGVLSNIKRKFGVKYRPDLCQALIESDFLNCLNYE